MTIEQKLALLFILVFAFVFASSLFIYGVGYDHGWKDSHAFEIAELASRVGKLEGAAATTFPPQR
jgi:hypothetical protein